MPTDYNAIAKEYQASKMMPWRKHVESYTFFQLVGELAHLNVLDLACGEGFYTRQLKLRGAAGVMGVDISDAMIQLANEAEEQQSLGVTYHCQNVLSLNLNKKFDLITATYLLNYAQTADELQQMGQIITNHLKPGGRFVTINSNPDYQAPVEAMFPYGFTRENAGYEEGAEITWRFYQPDMSHIAVVNYHLAKATHETALSQAGLTQIHWHSVGSSPAGTHDQAEDYWTAMLDYEPIIGLSAVKL
ncbi:class I SAM-dependent methyltransferase [Fibrella forsythiae]|uniref:Class I SAM-dependent methyltransferase n=1 Tax=Fibrella forsythiae TaxID=2817061 RepID=A0ABS3JNX9_9BACT|nr:class I SAM-dependent methyltransferase [Fibrella forsythiae]MBO0950924.1 class I SAM-dependent methyltransferase [Fibrella forsythiae]